MISRSILFFQLTIVILFCLESCTDSKEVSPWMVIDSSSVLIFESKHVPILPDQESATYFTNNANQYLMAIQKISKSDFDILYTYPITKRQYDSLLNQKKQSLTQASRLFNGVEIREIKDQKNEIIYVTAFINGVIVFSKSSILIENAIRTSSDEKKGNFKTENLELFQFPALKSDQGDIYVNVNNITDFFSHESILLNTIPLANELKIQSIYDVKENIGNTSLNGFSIGKNSSLSLFQGQKPVDFDVAKFVPNKTNELIHFGLSEIRSIKHLVDSSFLSKISIGNGITHISTSKTQFALVEIKSTGVDNFDFITSYSENYSSYIIRGIDGVLLKKYFGKIFPTKPFEFCALKDNYIILAYSPEELRTLIDAIDNDDTWGKTADFQKFYELGLQESNITLILKNPSLNSLASGFLKNYGRMVDSLRLSKAQWMSLQFSALDNNFYSTFNWYSTGARKQEEPKQTAKAAIGFTGDVMYASLVRNHTDGGQELLIQDSDFWIYLYSPTEGVRWKRQLGGKINSSMDQIDYYKNGKLQYFFSSNNKLYLIDRLGRDVNGFPKTLSSSIKSSGVVDYDKSRNYRYLISQSDNEIYLLDKEGKNLNEWGPKKFDKEILIHPEHIKIGGKDNFVITASDGKMNVFNRQGERVKTIELVNKGIFYGDYFIKPSMSFAETQINYLSKDGALVRQDMNGKVISVDNLLRGKNSKFILKRIINGNGYYICRIDSDKIAVFDEQAKLVFERSNNASTNMEFQCINYGDNKVVFAFFDIEQNLVQMTDMSGNDLFPTPLETDVFPLLNKNKSGEEIGIYYFPNKSVVYNPIKR